MPLLYNINRPLYHLARVLDSALTTFDFVVVTGTRVVLYFYVPLFNNGDRPLVHLLVVLYSAVTRTVTCARLVLNIDIL